MWNNNFRRLADSFIGGKGFAKSIRICLLGLAVCGVSELCADQKVNLTPLPKNIQVREGVLSLPSGFEVNIYQLGDSVVDEIGHFIEALEASSGISVSKISGSKNTLLKVRLNPEILNPEGYILRITDSGILVEASCTDGFLCIPNYKKNASGKCDGWSKRSKRDILYVTFSADNR